MSFPATLVGTNFWAKEERDFSMLSATSMYLYERALSIRLLKKSIIT
jgi:hypothetical protein